MTANKSIYKYVIIPSVLWGLLYFLCEIFVAGRNEGYFGLYWGSVWSIIVIVGMNRGRFLIKGQPHTLVYRIFFSICCIYLMFAAAITICRFVCHMF